MLYTQPFMNVIFYYQDAFAYYLIYPAYFFFDEFFSAYVTITEEMEKPKQRFFHYFVIGPLSLMLGLIFVLPAMLGLAFGSTVENFRRPYTYKTSRRRKPAKTPLKKTYTFCTTNLCLGPESVCRMNNLRHNKKRARRVGEILADEYEQTQQYNLKLNRKSTDELIEDDKAEASGDLKNRKEKKSAFNHDVLSEFPYLDFVLIQELFDRTCSRILTDQLLKSFPYVIYDVTVNSFRSNMHSLSSGLAFASKYPILDVDFKWYPDSWSQCWFTCKGLLMVKVLLGKQGESDVVGFIADTHLQSYQNDKKIIPKQLDNVIDWMKQFRRIHSKVNEIVAFEIVGGDFNFDNMSPGDRETASHSIFNTYVDLGRVSAGKEHDWTVGTELRQLLMYSKEISNPKLLRGALMDSSLKQLYVNNADIVKQDLQSLACTFSNVDVHGQVALIPEGGRRRIDYIFYQKNVMVEPIGLNTVTQLAALTDHLPVTLTLKIDLPKEQADGDKK